MKSVILTAALLATTASFAHFQIGTYSGQDQNGQACAIELKSVAFIDGYRHPLAERVEARVNGETWELQHSPQIDKANGTVRPEHAVLTGVKGIKTSLFNGGKAVIFTMDESPEVNGPVDFVYIEDNYLDATQNKKTVCSGLTFQR